MVGVAVEQPDSGVHACSDDIEFPNAHHLSSSSSKVSEEVEVVGRKHAVVDDVGTVEGETVARTVRGWGR